MVSNVVFETPRIVHAEILIILFFIHTFRMIVCAGSSMNDFYVVMHEMGHIMYYMLASVQPTVFQVNSIV